MRGERQGRIGVRLRVTVTIVATAVAGFAVGLAFGRSRPAPVPEFTWDQAAPVGPETTLRSLPGSALFDQLGLDEDQRVQIDSLLAIAQAELDSSMTPLLEQVRTTVAATHDAVRGVLTPDQVTRFDSLLAATPVIRLRGGGR